MIRRPPRSTQSRSSAASDVYKRQGKLLEVGLVTARPVGRLLGVRCTQDVEDTLQALRANDVADTHEIAVLGGHLDGQIALGNLEHQVDLFLAPDGASPHLFNQSRTVVRVNNRLANLERHV